MSQSIIAQAIAGTKTIIHSPSEALNVGTSLIDSAVMGSRLLCRHVHHGRLTSCWLDWWRRLTNGCGVHHGDFAMHDDVWLV
jgi:hypothetical protein